MRRTRHVVLPVRSWQYIGFLIVSLACLTFGLVSRDREGHAGSLAGPELNHLAPHDVDACPNLNKLTDVPSCADSRYDRNFLLGKSWPTEIPGHSRASSRKHPRDSRTQNSDRRSESRVQEARDSRKTERAIKNTGNRADATRRFVEARSRAKDLKNRRSMNPVTGLTRSFDESRDGASRSYERRSRSAEFRESKSPARVGSRVEVNGQRRVASRRSEILDTRDRRQRFLESRRVNGPQVRENRDVRRMTEERTSDIRRSQILLLDRRSRSVETLQGRRDVSLNRRSLTRVNSFDSARDAKDISNLSDRNFRTMERRTNRDADRRENRNARVNRLTSKAPVSRDSSVDRISRADLNDRRSRTPERRENNNIVRRENRETEATRRFSGRSSSRDSSMRRNSRMNSNELRSQHAERRENRETLAKRRSLDRTTYSDSLANRISRSDLNDRRSRSVEQRENNNIVRRDNRRARTDRRSLERSTSHNFLTRRNSVLDLNERRSRTIGRRENREARTDRRSLERFAPRDSSSRRNSVLDLNERRSRSVERRENREARTDRRSLERFASRDSSSRRNSVLDSNERRSRSVEHRENREARTDRRSLERFASRDSSARRNSPSDLAERRSRSRVVVLRSVERRIQGKRSTRNTLPLSLERSKRSDSLARSVERREMTNLARQDSKAYDEHRSLNERNLRRAQNRRVTRDRYLNVNSDRRSQIPLIREERVNRFARTAQAPNSRRVVLLKSVESEENRDNRRSASRRILEKRSSARVLDSARKEGNFKSVEERILTEKLERRVDLPVLKNTKDSRREIARSAHRRSIELFKNNLSRSNAKLYRDDDRKLVSRISFKYETVPFSTYEIMRQTAIMTLCAAYAMHIYNGKGSSIRNIFERLGRLVIW